jgi:hypothetical protein
LWTKWLAVWLFCTTETNPYVFRCAPRGSRSSSIIDLIQIVWSDLKLENFLVFSDHGIPDVKMARTYSLHQVHHPICGQVDFDSAVLSGEPMRACTPIYLPPELAQSIDSKTTVVASTKHDGPLAVPCTCPCWTCVVFVLFV